MTNLNLTKFRKFAFYLGLLLPVSGCVPIPWFPEDPYSDDMKSLLSDHQVERREVVQKFGQPWANLDVKTFVYIAPRKSAYVLFYEGGAAGINRDYFLVVDFDEQGFVSEFETFSDSLRHNHCFENGVCLEASTFNIPLAPYALDAEAKMFLPDPEKCVVYIYRDKEGIGLAENGYANISYRNVSLSHKFRRVATSVEYGYSKLEFTPTDALRIKIEMEPPKYGDLDDLSDNDPDREWKEPVTQKIACHADNLIFFRLYVPEKNDRGIEFHTVESAVARQKIQGMKLLLERWQFLEEELRNGKFIQ